MGEGKGAKRRMSEKVRLVAAVVAAATLTVGVSSSSSSSFWLVCPHALGGEKGREGKQGREGERGKNHKSRGEAMQGALRTERTALVDYCVYTAGNTTSHTTSTTTTTTAATTTATTPSNPLPIGCHFFFYIIFEVLVVHTLHSQ